VSRLFTVVQQSGATPPIRATCLLLCFLSLPLFFLLFYSFLCVLPVAAVEGDPWLFGFSLQPSRRAEQSRAEQKRAEHTKQSTTHNSRKEGRERRKDTGRGKSTLAHDDWPAGVRLGADAGRQSPDLQGALVRSLLAASLTLPRASASLHSCAFFVRRTICVPPFSSLPPCATVSPLGVGVGPLLLQLEDDTGSAGKQAAQHGQSMQNEE